MHDTNKRSWYGLTTPLSSNFLFTNLFKKKIFISLLFHLFFLILTCSCQYSYNLMSTSNCMCRSYMEYTRHTTRQVYKLYPCSLRVHLLHLISIMSFKLGHVSIPKRRIFLPLFLFCAYDSSVLQAIVSLKVASRKRRRKCTLKSYDRFTNS